MLISELPANELYFQVLICSINSLFEPYHMSALFNRASKIVPKWPVHRSVLFFSPIGSPPATGTGTLQIVLEDVNDNAPTLYQTVSSVCEDAKDVKVVFGALDKDIYPNTDPFKFELNKQFGQDKVWKITRINSKSIQKSNLSPTSQS